MELAKTMDEMVRSIGAMPRELNAGMCFGAPVEHEGRVVIPVARVGFGGGLGFGGGTGTGTKPTSSSDGVERAESGEGGGGGG